MANRFDEILARAIEYIHLEVTAGYTPVSDIPRVVSEYFENEFEPAELIPHFEHLTRSSVQDHLLAQVDWPVPTDYDRLAAAFRDLETYGIMARQNFSCCGTCGVGEILEEIEAAMDEGKSFRGYVFFHIQDTVSAVDGRGLYLCCGSYPLDEDDAIPIGDEVVTGLQAYGLEVSWNRSFSYRIRVEIDWKRRLNPDLGEMLRNQ